MPASWGSQLQMMLCCLSSDTQCQEGPFQPKGKGLHKWGTCWHRDWVRGPR